MTTTNETTAVDGTSTHWKDGPLATADTTIRCPGCDWVGEGHECSRDIPAGHKKWCLFKCPECGDRLARIKGTNRAVDEDRVDASIEDVYADEYGTGVTLLHPGDVDPESIGGGVDYVVSLNPMKGKIARQPIDADDLTDNPYGAAGVHVEAWSETWAIGYDYDDPTSIDKDYDVTRFVRVD